jgi:hypothetical protein
MGNSLTQRIRAWFLKHDGDGEFLLGNRAFPYSIIGPGNTAAGMIFTTKPNIVSASMYQFDVLGGCGMIGRYGLPNRADLSWIRKMVGAQPLWFLGDMDPTDLMVFAWLRASLRPKHVVYFGINDALLKACRLSPSKSVSIPFTSSERKSLPLLMEVLPDLREMVGQKALRMLQRGHKIELEAVLKRREARKGS